MKEDMMRRAIGAIDDRLIEGAEKQQSANRARISWVRWASIAAAAVLAVSLGVAVLPGILKGNGPAVTPDTSQAGSGDGGLGEYRLEKSYTYRVDAGKYASYVRGKGIADRYVGGKLEDDTVTAGWVDADGKMLTEEHARAEIFGIDGVSADVAVAIRFLDELEAETTAMYFVIINPAADPGPVRPWVITPMPYEQLDGDGNIRE